MTAEKMEKWMQEIVAYKVQFSCRQTDGTGCFAKLTTVRTSAPSSFPAELNEIQLETTDTKTWGKLTIDPDHLITNLAHYHIWNSQIDGADLRISLSEALTVMLDDYFPGCSAETALSDSNSCEYEIIIHGKTTAPVTNPEIRSARRQAAEPITAGRQFSARRQSFLKSWL